MKQLSDICDPMAGRSGRLDPHTAESMARLFGALGDAARVRIIALLDERETCVSEIASLIGASQSAISHQLRLLRDLRLVRAEKRGRRVYYALDDDHVRGLFRQGLDHVGHLRAGEAHDDG